MSRCEEAPLLIDFYSSGELDAVMTTLQIVQEYGTAVIGEIWTRQSKSHSSKLAVSCVSAPKTSNQKGNK